MSTEFKVVVCGKYACGKTSLLNRFLYGTFSNRFQTTIGAAYLLWKFETANRKINVGFFDTAGQERFSSLIPMYYRNAHVIFYCISADTNPQDEIEKIRSFLENVNGVSNHCMIYLVITKIDLKYGANLDLYENFNSLMKYSCNDKKFSKMFLTSSLSGDGIDILFETLSSDLLKLPEGAAPLSIERVPAKSYFDNKMYKNCCMY